MHARFDRVVRQYLRDGTMVLDAGAGRGIRYPYDYARTVRRVVGADLNPAVARNTNLTDAVVADLAALPFRDGTFDLAFSKYVFEHLERPRPVMRELRRVLAPRRPSTAGSTSGEGGRAPTRSPRRTG